MGHILIKNNLFFIALLLSFFGIHEVAGQVDSTRLLQLIKETQDNFIYPFAHGVFLSPYEIRIHHRDQKIKQIEMVDVFDFYRMASSEEEKTPFLIKDNRTIIQKPDDRYNSYTYVYHKDGRIEKILRGGHLDDLFLYDEDGYLIQHGFGGELKRAEREGKTFEWFNVNRKQLEYIASYDEQDRISQFKTMGHLFGPGVEYEIEEYLWNGNQIVSLNTVMNYKEGEADSTFIHFTYDSLGLISAIQHRNDGETVWSSVQFTTRVEYQDNNHIKITISETDNILLSMTFDEYDNWIEMVKPYATLRREIKYRKRKRRK